MSTGVSLACCSGGGGGTPADPDTSVQFNNAGAFGGDAFLTWDAVNHRLAVGPAYATLPSYLQNPIAAQLALTYSANRPGLIITGDGNDVAGGMLLSVARAPFALEIDSHVASNGGGTTVYSSLPLVRANIAATQITEFASEGVTFYPGATLNNWIGLSLTTPAGANTANMTAIFVDSMDAVSGEANYLQFGGGRRLVIDRVGNVTTQGFYAGREQTEPAAPDADGYRIFAKDTGGKTQLLVRFNSGVSQVIATEP